MNEGLREAMDVLQAVQVEYQQKLYCPQLKKGEKK